MDQTLDATRFKECRELSNMQMNCLKYMGLWAVDPKNSALTHWAYFLYNKLVLIILYTFSITVLVDIYSSIDDLSVATDDGCVFAGIFLVIFKIMNFQHRRKKIVALIEHILQNMDRLCDCSPWDTKSVIDVYISRNKMSFYGFNTLGFSLVIALLFLSPTQNGLPIGAKYPFNTTVSPGREIGYMVQICAVSCGMAAIVAMDNTVLLICSLLILQFNILNVNFENCRREIHQRRNLDGILYEHNRNSDNCNPSKADISFVSRYKRYLQFHQQLLLTVNDFNDIFSSSMFTQMISSTSMICLTSFQAVVVGGGKSNILKSGVYLSAAVSQLLYTCWLGNELTYSSSLVGKSQWLSGWNSEHFPDIGRLLTLSMMFSRQTCTLTAGAFYVLSLESFIAIMRGSYSFFTLLNNMHTAGGR